MTPRTLPDIDRLLDSLLEAGRWLRSVSTDTLVTHLAQACSTLADDTRGSPSLMTQHRDELAHATGLSAPMIDWAGRTSIAPYANPDRLAAELCVTERTLCGDSPYPGDTTMRIAVPSRLCTIVLGGHVPTAVLRATMFPLMARAPVCVKTSVGDHTLPNLWKQALTRCDAKLGACIEVVDRTRFETPAEQWLPYLLERSDAVHVYGADDTVRAVRHQTPANALFGAHGHGLGVVLVSSSVLQNDAVAREAARAVALDVAAYDQRGCLSPHAVWLCAPGDAHHPVGPHALTPRRWAQWLHEELTHLDETLPEGKSSLPAQAQQAQWRGVARATGELWEQASHAVAFCESPSNTLVLGPGRRHVWVTTCASMRAFIEAITPLGPHLKVIGLGCDPREAASVSQSLLQALPPPLCPRVCEIGTMQTPPLGAVWDGEDPWAHLTRYKSRQ
jgi:hypothetical protein